LGLFNDYIGSEDTLSKTHIAAVQDVNNNFLLSDINKLRVESLLNL